jgi:hypothetical protein
VALRTTAPDEVAKGVVLLDGDHSGYIIGIESCSWTTVSRKCRPSTAEAGNA